MVSKKTIEKLNDLSIEIMDSISVDLKNKQNNDACEKIKALAELLSAKAMLI